MTTVDEQIQSAANAISSNIAALGHDRPLLAQNILSQLRNLVEGVAVRLRAGRGDVEFEYPLVSTAISYVGSQGKLNFLKRFHELLRVSASHFTVDGDASERLMLKYYEYLHRIRSLLRDHCEIDVLANLESFPIDLDPSLSEYHEKIAERVEAVRSTKPGGGRRDRYYIHKTRPFFVSGRIYYEVTFYRAINKVSKFDRVIAFTDIDMTEKYSANLTLHPDTIDVLGRTMPIILISDWEVSIRPCEFDSFGRLLGFQLKTRTSFSEYQYLMRWLTANSGSLIDLLDLSHQRYETVRNQATATVNRPRLFPVLDKARQVVRSEPPGHNIIRYLMLRMHNQILKAQCYPGGCTRLSNLRLRWECIPFDEMPFCTSLRKHNPRYWDLLESLDTTGREHELLARRVKNNVEQRGMLYTPETELGDFGDVPALISTYNSKVYYRHTKRKLIQDKGHVFLLGYEEDTVAIVEKLQQCASSGINGYTVAVERWLEEMPRGIDDEIKRDALKRLFCQSNVALIYGAAGTGKSTMVDHIANYFNDKSKLFLANTNPAVDNLKRRVSAQNSYFKTIASQISQTSRDQEYDLLVIDECSTVSNSDLLKVLKKTEFKLLVLVGDVYQIESIQFGNWFSIIRDFLPSTSIFELTTPYRTNNRALLAFWDKVRNITDDIAESIAKNKYSAVLDDSLFEPQEDDEIILCLNYDGLYGINNVNRFLQSNNPNPTVSWRISTYKVGDPVLFNETDRFRPVIYNNLKGRIVSIKEDLDHITFDVELDRPLSEFDVVDDLQYIEGSTVRFSVYDHDTSDEDDDTSGSIVPFQIAYAVSIHKAQGLEYDSVKVVITDANEEDITHSIFYTAITRARQSLRIFWTPETQQAVLSGFRGSRSARRDVSLLCSRCGLSRVART